MTGSDRDGLAAIEAPPQPGRRVLLGLSGGVDSSVAALLLKEQGYEVIAARMRVYDGPNDPGLSYGCYGRSSADDERSAEALAGRLGLDFHILQCSGPWRDYVLEYFRREYLAGRTPNPCIRCNEMVKFGFLPLLARKKGIEFDYFATGHYARIEKDPAGNWITLKRGRDPRKDQSYFLYRLSREQLGRIIFPLGDFNKEEVRALAKERQLASHDRPDSQDFYGSDYSALINAPERGGHIVDSSGRVLGRHRGFWHYTPGQRKGLGVCGPAPLYVLEIRAETNEVVVGTAEENSFPGCFIDDTNFLLPRPPEGARLWAKMRSAQALKEVEIGAEDGQGRLRINFIRPMSGLAPGQSLVLYQNDLVVGGGIICGP